MLQFVEGNITHVDVLTQIGARSFIESHGSSASEKDISAYVKEKFSAEYIKKELQDKNAVFRIAYYDGKPVAYSKILPNTSNPNIPDQNICKMERLYVLQDFFNKKIGKPLFDLNVEIAKSLNQKGIWLYVWTGNPRALRFYQKQGFKKIGETYFKISETHSNPNYWMYLEF